MRRPARRPGSGSTIRRRAAPPRAAPRPAPEPSASPAGADGSSSAASRASPAARSAAPHRCTQSASGVSPARPPTARTVPATSVQSPAATAWTATVGSASRRCTGRCRVGRPTTTTCVGRSGAIAGAPSNHGPVRSAAGHAAEPGSAITGTCGSCGSSRSCRAPWPAMTRVGAVGSSGSGAADEVIGGTAVHGPPPARPAGVTPVPSGTSGSAKGRFRCTGPGAPPRAPVAAARQRSTVERQRALSTAPPPTAASTDRRTAAPKIPGCAIVWLAPVPIACGGRSAVTASSGTPACDASSTAGCRFATAVPEVVHTGTGRPERRASPSARNAAVRSSIRTCSRRRPSASAAFSANDRGALREPGHSTASVTPQRTSSSTSTSACIVDGFTAGA